MEFHPLAERYPLMTEPELAHLIENMKENGYDKHFPIVRHQKKILAGRNRFRASKIAKVKPKIIDLPKGIDPEVFVATENEFRKHYTHDILSKLRKDRIERIQHASANGHSTRDIAKEEKVSQTQVVQDLKKGKSEQGGCSVASGSKSTTSSAKGSGKKTQCLIPELADMNLSPKIKPELENLKKDIQAKVALKIREGMNPRQAIDHVLQVSATKAMDKEIKEERDQLGFPLPTKALRDVFADPFLTDCIKNIDNMIQGCKSAARWAVYMLVGDVVDALEKARLKFENALPYSVHQECKGLGCDMCRGKGYFPEWRHKEREYEIRMEAKK